MVYKADQRDTFENTMVAMADDLKSTYTELGRDTNYGSHPGDGSYAAAIWELPKGSNPDTGNSETLTLRYTYDSSNTYAPTVYLYMGYGHDTNNNLPANAHEFGGQSGRASSGDNGLTMDTQTWWSVGPDGFWFHMQGTVGDGNDQEMAVGIAAVNKFWDYDLTTVADTTNYDYESRYVYWTDGQMGGQRYNYFCNQDGTRAPGQAFVGVAHSSLADGYIIQPETYLRHDNFNTDQPVGKIDDHTAWDAGSVPTHGDEITFDTDTYTVLVNGHNYNRIAKQY